MIAYPIVYMRPDIREGVEIEMPKVNGDRRRPFTVIAATSPFSGEQIKGADNEAWINSLVEAYVPREIKHAGVLLQEAREGVGISPRDLAGRRRLNGYITAFEEGRIPKPDLRLLIDVASGWIPLEDKALQELAEIAETIDEESKWAWRIDHDNLPMDTRIKLVRLSHGLSKTKFAEVTGMSASAIESGENGVEPKLSTLNSILGYDQFDRKYRRTSQRMRLDNEHIPPKSLNEFFKDSVGQNLEYFRVQRGYIRDDLGDLTNFSYSYIASLEKDEAETLVPQYIRSIFDGLEIPLEIRKYLVLKHFGLDQLLSQELIDNLLDTFYFTTGYEPMKEPYTQRDQKTYSSIENSSPHTFGSALRQARSSLGLTQSDVDGDNGPLPRIENGKQIPEDYVVARYAIKMGLSVLDETAFLLQQLANKDRANSKRGANLRR